MTNAKKPREPSGKLDFYDWHNNSLNQARADLPTRHIYHDETQGKNSKIGLQVLNPNQQIIDKLLLISRQKEKSEEKRWLSGCGPV